MAIPSYIAVLKHYNTAPEDVKQYLVYLPLLVEKCDWDVCIAYQFIRIETAQNRTIYCGVVKLHHAHPQVAGGVMYSQHMTRKSFLDLFKTIYGHSLPNNIVDKLKLAEGVRDKIVHGKGFSEPNARQAIVDAIDYASLLNEHLEKTAGFRPFGDLRGFKGRSEPLDKSTTMWLLKGIGLTHHPMSAPIP